MYREIYNPFIDKLNAGLSDLNAKNNDPLKRFREALLLIRELLRQLRELVISVPFISAEQEIYFFKKVKPLFRSAMLYEHFIYTLKLNVPSGTRDTVIAYYEQELVLIQRFISLNKFYYEYYKCELVELDHFLFIRGAKMPSVFISEVPEHDPEFSTELDYLFAKIMAYERLEQAILESLGLLVDSGLSFKAAGAVKDLPAVLSSGLTWTGESINLVEVAYGIWLTGQLNHGNAGIAQIIRWLEESLQVKIGRAFRRWTEISARKNLSPTKYLDSMKKAILDRIEGELSAVKK